MTFSDRTQAGRLLAEALKKYQDLDPVIYALPKGGVITASEVARIMSAPLDLVIIRKIGHPGNPEYAICAISVNGHMVCNEQELMYINHEWLQREIKRHQEEARQRHQLYLSGRVQISAQGKTAIIVDDGIATGLSMKATIKEIKQQKPKTIVVAVPVLPQETAEQLKAEVDDLVALEIPKEFAGAVGAYYTHFPQVSDEEVIQLLQR